MPTKTNPVRASAFWVMKRVKYVSVNDSRINEAADNWRRNGFPEIEWSNPFHLQSSNEKTILTYLFLLDALNFCFWAKEEKRRWTIEHKNEKHKGYFALSLALKIFFEENPEKANFNYFSGISFSDFKKIFQGGKGLLFLKTRREIVRAISQAMLKKYKGDPRLFLAGARNQCSLLVPKIVRELPFFNDTAHYKGKNVYFLKRAQILAGDIWGVFQGRGLGGFSDIDYLTAFPDYKLPQILEYRGIFEYMPALKKKIAVRGLIVRGSEEEVEIRSATVLTVECLKERLKKNGIEKSSVKIDWALWNESEHLKMPSPYHLTKTIFY